MAPPVRSRRQRWRRDELGCGREGGMHAVINLVYYCRSLEECERRKAPGHLGVPLSAKPKENTTGMQKASLQPRVIVPAMF